MDSAQIILNPFHMKPEIAQNALVFLSRAQLSGKEALAMAEVQQALSVFVPKKEEVEEAPKKDSKKDQ